MTGVKEREAAYLTSWRRLVESPEADKARRELGSALDNFPLCVKLLEGMAARDAYGDLHLQSENAYTAVLEEACLRIMRHAKKEWHADPKNISLVERYCKVHRERTFAPRQHSAHTPESVKEDFPGEYRETPGRERRIDLELRRSLPGWRE